MSIGAKSLHQVANGVRNQWKVALLLNVEWSWACAFLEKCTNILHEFIKVEVNADGSLKNLKLVLLEEKIVADALGDFWIARWALLSDRQSLHSLNDQVTREVTANQADHLVVVEGRYNLIVRGRMEYFLNLLKEWLSVELSGRDKGIFAEKDMLTFESGVEVFIEQVERAFISTFKYDLDSIL